MKKLKRLLSLCLILALVLGQFPLSGRPAYAADTQEIIGVTPVGTTIDLFDYWVNSDDKNDIIQPADAYLTFADRGINSHGALKFWYTGPGGHNSNINVWTGHDGDIKTGIVQNRLGSDNYPVLAAGLPTGVNTANTPATTTEQSLAYLFDDRDIPDAKTAYTDVRGLFQVDEDGYYSFNSAKTGAQLYTDITDPKYNSFRLINFADGLPPYTTGFFPFNTLDADGNGYLKQDGSGVVQGGNGVKDSHDIDHFFGSHMTTQFVQSENGMTDDGKAVTYDFIGDDDVWIFIDGILVGDVGGIHNAATVHIDFATGEVTYTTTATRDAPAHTLLDCYTNALGGANNVQYFIRHTTYEAQGKTISDEPTTDPNAANIAKISDDVNTYVFQKTEAGNWIFADGTYHTLDFFYLERGAGEANMNLKFNLEEIPPTYIHKTDQDGEPIESVQFDLYVVKPKADTTTGKAFTEWTTGEPTEEVVNYPVATGTTDEDGMLTLRYSDNMGAKAGKMASLADIFTSYQENTVKQVTSSGGLQYHNALLLELREVTADDVLKNYRSSQSTSLRLENINGTYILRSNDRWNNGVYATPMAVISAPKTIQSMDIKLNETVKLKEPIEFDLSDAEYAGKVGLFAVVLAWVGDGTPNEETIIKEENWAPVYGSPEAGWTIEKLNLDAYDGDYAEALGAAIGRYALTHTAEGSFIYSFQPSPSGSYKAEIANLPGEIDQYYFMIADNNGNITDEDDLAKVKYTTSFYFSTADRPEEMTGEQTYRINHRASNFQRNFGSTIGVPNIENRLMVQRLDAQGNTVIGAEFSLYAADQVNVAADGTATLKADATPLKTLTTEDQTHSENSKLKAHINANGVASFEGLPTGEYYLMESEAPTGYAPNNKLVHVVVDDKGVHAYAGKPQTEDNAEVIDETKGIPFGDGDGISVLVGVGNLVNTMANFASQGMIDTTLTDIYALRAKGEAEVDADGKTTLSWTQIDPSNNELQRKWRLYDANAAMEYSTYNEPTDYLGRPNQLSNLENPYGYVSASGWNWDLISQNYYGIYDPGEHYSTFLKKLNDAEQKLVEQETRTKTALPTTDYKEGDEQQRLDISDGYTSFGNKILNGLFSGSTMIRVAATAVGDLVISKQVETADDDSTAADTQFAFSVSFTYEAPTIAQNEQQRPINMIGDIDLTPQLTGTYNYTISKNGAQTETGTLTIAAADGVTEPDKDTPYHIAGMTAASGSTTHFDTATHKLKLADGETIRIIGLPRGTTYTVAEDNVVGYQQTVTATATSDVTNADRQQYTPTPPSVSGISVSNTIAVPDQTDTLAYTNSKNDGQSKTISYTVEYYKDGVKVSNDTQTVSKTVHINDADTLTVDKTAINTQNKYPGYYFSKSVPSPIPDTVNNGDVIKVYYVYDSSGDDGGDDNDNHNANTPTDLNITDHIAYIIGYPESNVRPEGSITRAEAATIFFRLLTDEARAKHWCQTNAYTDVTAEMWCNNAISTLSKMGIISGDPDGSFRPNDPITRAELAKISVGFFDTAGKVQSAQTYADVPTGEWYARYVAAADMLKLVEGYPDKTFRPNNSITRAETCTMVNRILGRAPHADHLLADNAMLTWPDNPKQAWYYAQIQEATNSHDYRWIKVDGKNIGEWTAKLQERSWADLEKEWSEAYDAAGKDVVND